MADFSGRRRVRLSLSLDPDSRSRSERESEQTSQRKRGRKPKPVAERRTHAVACRLTDAELARLDERRPAGVSRGEWLRRLALARRLPASVPSVNLQLWAELGRLAGNLNQHQRAINEGRADPPPVDLAALRAEVAALRAALIDQEDES